MGLPAMAVLSSWAFFKLETLSALSTMEDAMVDASRVTPVAIWHEGGRMFAGDVGYYPKGWYVLDGESARPLVFADDPLTQVRLVEDPDSVFGMA